MCDAPHTQQSCCCVSPLLTVYCQLFILQKLTAVLFCICAESALVFPLPSVENSYATTAAHQKCLQYRVLMTFHCPAQSRGGSMMNKNAQRHAICIEHKDNTTRYHPVREYLTLTHPLYDELEHIFITFFARSKSNILVINHAMLFSRLHKDITWRIQYNIFGHFDTLHWIQNKEEEIIKRTEIDL